MVKKRDRETNRYMGSKREKENLQCRERQRQEMQKDIKRKKKRQGETELRP